MFALEGHDPGAVEDFCGADLRVALAVLGAADHIDECVRQVEVVGEFHRVLSGRREVILTGRSMPVNTFVI
jgi:hypothetical protein